MRRSALLAAALLLTLAGCDSGGPSTTPADHVVARGGRQAPVAPPAECVTHEGQHAMGACAPSRGVAPSAPPLAARSAAAAGTGPDLSNNNPIFGLASWRRIRAHGHRFAYFKVVEGVRFVDGTASRMARDARAAGVIPGGYDFLHVCTVNPYVEANLFVRYLRADGLLGPNTLPPAADAEYPISPACSAAASRLWLARWQHTVETETHRIVVIYTGKWWWDPHMGCYWPRRPAWVASYPVLVRPCGLAHATLHQFGSSIFNGVSSDDMSVFYGTVADLARFANGHYVAPLPPPSRHAKSLCHVLRRVRARKHPGAYARRRGARAKAALEKPRRISGHPGRYRYHCGKRKGSLTRVRVHH